MSRSDLKIQMWSVGAAKIAPKSLTAASSLSYRGANRLSAKEALHWRIDSAALRSLA